MRPRGRRKRDDVHVPAGVPDGLGVAPETCLVTTNRYQRIFRHETDGRWVSAQGPEGNCGVLDVATLSDAGGVRWTMEIKKTVTKKDGRVQSDRRAAGTTWLAEHSTTAAVPIRPARRVEPIVW